MIDDNYIVRNDGNERLNGAELVDKYGDYIVTMVYTFPEESRIALRTIKDN